jgi:uncharacterized membrane protein HdeD (DUF308 family)
MNQAASPILFARAKGGHWRAVLIADAGAIVMLISLAAALLPIASGLSRASVIGTMMVAAGLVEVIAASLRARNRVAAALPGVATLIAGTLFAVEPFGAFVPAVRLVIGWLAARGLLLALTSFDVRGSVRFWTILTAATDISLSSILYIGLTATTITLVFFGPTPEIVGSFAWVLALSFVATGMLLIDVAACEASEAAAAPEPTHHY